MPLVRRVPKRGFTNIFRKVNAVVNVADLASREDLPERVDPEVLAAHGLVRRGKRVKVLGDGEIGRALTVAAHQFSESARAKIEAAGGTCEELA
jgi:large subunit ribosomal protein L15